MLNLIINNFYKLKKKGFFYIFFSGFFNKLISFILNIYVVRFLEKSNYGLYVYTWNIYSFFILFNGLGITSGTLQLCSENSDDRALSFNIFRYSLTIGCIFDTLISLLLILLGFFYTFKFSGANSYILSLSILPFFQLIFNLITSYLLSQKETKKYSFVMSLHSVLLAVFSVLLTMKFQSIGLIYSQYLSILLSLLLYCIIFKKYDFVFFNFKKEHIENNLKKILYKISLVSVLNDALSSLLYLVDILILGIVDADTTILANYKIATVIPSSLVFIPSLVVTFIYPYFAENRNNHKWCLNAYKKIIMYFGSCNFLISLCLIIFSQLIFTQLYGNKYIDSVPIFRILAAGYFFSATFRIISGNILASQRKFIFNFWVSLLCGILNIFLDYFLIKRFGPFGAAYATFTILLLSSIVSTLYLLNIFNKKD